MGIYHFNCDHCGQATSDEYENNEIFVIEQWGEYNVCSLCTFRVKSLLRLKEPLSYPCILQQKKTKKRNAFLIISQLREWLKNNANVKSYKFGVYKKTEWSRRQMESWIGEGTCGGMNKDDIVAIAESVLNRKKKDQLAKDKQPDNDSKIYGTVFIGWRGYKRVQRQYYETLSDLVKIRFDFASPEELLGYIAKYEKEYNLENSPLLVTSMEDETCENLPEHLADFCFPDESKSLEWVGTFDQLEAYLLSPTTVPPNQGTLWAITPDFLSHQKKKTLKAMDTLKRKLDQIQTLNETIKRCKTDSESTDEDDDDEDEEEDGSDKDENKKQDLNEEEYSNGEKDQDGKDI